MVARIRSGLTRPTKVQAGRSAIVGMWKHRGGTKREATELSRACPLRSFASCSEPSVRHADKQA